MLVSRQVSNVLVLFVIFRVTHMAHLEQITLPPLIESEEERKLLASRLEKSRTSFRKFRENLSKEIGASKGKRMEEV